MTNSSPVGSLGLGVTAGLTASAARELAARCADLGYDSLWSNDEPGAPGLETPPSSPVEPRSSSSAWASSPSISTGRPGSRPRSTGWASIRRSSGSASGRGGCGPNWLRCARRWPSYASCCPTTRIVVGAMRRELSRLGGTLADGVLLNWMVPAHAEQGRRWVHEGADAAGRSAPITATYVRVAVGEGAPQRLRDEEGRYRTLDAPFFAAMDVPLGTVGVAAPARPGVIEALAAYRRSVDLPIVRVLADDDIASLVAVRQGGGAVAAAELEARPVHHPRATNPPPRA